MNDKVVIAGTVKLRNTIKAKTNLHNVINGTPSWVVNTGGGGIVYPHYSGPYAVTPSESVQTLDTDGKVMDDDVTVNPIPSQYIVPTGTKTINQNGTHDVAQYESAVVDVQGGITPTGTKQISIASNGTVTEDVTNYANAEITTNVPASAVDTGTKSINANGTHDVVGYANASVNVPNSYSASDEGKVVSNGALVAQTSDTVTENDTYDTTLINSLTVNVSGGGGVSIDDVAMKSISGAITISTATSIAERAFDGYKLITSIYSESVTGIDWNYAMSGMTALQSVDLPNLAGDLRAYTFSGNTNLESVNIPKVTKMSGYDFQNCKKLVKLAMPALNNGTNTSFADGATLLQKCDLGDCTKVQSVAFRNTSLNILVLRRTSLVGLDNINAFTGTPFASGGAGGTIYIPKVLYDALGTGTNDYESATNWSTVNGYGTITWAKIEGSYYETHYADDTVIPTT